MPKPRGLHASIYRKLCCCSPCDACPPAAANPHTRSRAVGRARCGISRPWWSPVLRPDPRSSGVGVLYMYSPCNVLKKPKVECRVWFIGLVSSNKFSHFTGMPSFLKTAYCIAFSYFDATIYGNLFCDCNLFSLDITCVCSSLVVRLLALDR